MNTGYQWPSASTMTSTTIPPSGASNARGGRDQRGVQNYRSDVHVQNIPVDMNEEQVEDIFLQCGNVVSVRLLSPRDQRTTKVGFVSFASDEEASIAIEKLNGYQANHSCSLRVIKPREKSSSMSTTGNKVHVMNIPLHMTQVELQNIFTQCGNVTSVNILPPKPDRNSTIGFVEYSEQEGANVALKNLNGYQTGGCTLKVSKALTRDSGNKGAEMSVPSHSEPKVHVMNIPLDMTEENFRAIFAECGEVVSVKIIQAQDGQTSTFGFVTFTSEEAVNEAISQLNGFPAGDFIFKISRARGRSTAPQEALKSSGNRTEQPVHISQAQTNAFQSTLASRPPNFPVTNGLHQQPMLNGTDGQSGHGYGPVQMAPAQTVTQSVMINQSQRGLQAAPGRSFMNTVPTYNQPSTSFSPSSPEGKIAASPQTESIPISGFSSSQEHNLTRSMGNTESKSCHKCGEFGHFARECNSQGGNTCHRCGMTGHFARECPSTTVKGGGSVCHNCGEVGHISRECPKNTANQRGACHKCGETGHFARECPSGGNQCGRTCHRCGETGHFARECPSGGNQDGRTCHKCGETGHFARECPSGGNQDGRTCHKCGETGHFARECPTGGNQDGRTCHKCSETGHFARECPSGGNQDGRTCHKCGETGHFARECPSAQLSDGNRGAGPVTYVPPELPENPDSLFEDVPHSGINFDKYDDIPVNVTGLNAPAPIQSFDEAGMFEQCAANIRRAKFTKPTPVQKHAIPIINSGRDLMACAQTGSGKTIAFLVPVLTGMLKHGLVNRSSLTGEVQEPVALCIAPTRELARQIHREASKFALGTVMRVVVCYGGVRVDYQLQNIERGCHFLICTPGRLEDFVNRGKISLASVRYLILDEADRMLDMGFEPVIRKIVEQCSMPNKYNRQTIMLSATFPDQIQHLAADFLKDDYLFCAVGRVGGTNTDITQHILQVGSDEKRNKLFEILQQSGTDRTLVFVELKRTADFLACLLSENNFSSTSISSDRSQQEREAALEDFRSGRAPIMVATSVAARGLDIADVKHVINYDLPQAIEEYVHRIGRTGRIGNQGKATSFYEPGRDDKLARSLVKVLSEALQEVPEWLERAAEEAVGSSYGPAGGKFASRDRRQKYGNSRNAAPPSNVNSGEFRVVTQDMTQMKLNDGDHFQNPAPRPAAVTCEGADDDEDWD